MSHKEILESYRDEICGTLRDLVSFKSVQAEPLEGRPYGEEIHKAYLYMISKAESDGFATFDADGYGGHIEWEGAAYDGRGEIVSAADETLGIPVHLDVVPAGDDWTYDPWGGEITDGRMYGRGTSDNKGAVTAVYFAMKALKESGFAPVKNIRLILGLDEESGWGGMDKYYEKAFRPDFGFAPDANFPVINGEKGLLVFDIAKKLDRDREYGLILRSVKGGNAPNMVPDHCRAILVYEDAQNPKGAKAKKGGKARAANTDTNERDKSYDLVRKAVSAFRDKTGEKISCKGAGNAMEIISQGVSAHGSVPYKGVNAISIMMDFLSELPLANESARDFVDFYRTKIGYEIKGESLGIAMRDEPSGSLIVNPGMIDLGSEAAILTVNVRHPVTNSEDDVYKALMPVLDANGLGLVKVMGLAPLYYPPDDPMIELCMDVYRENTGDAESKPIVFGGGTYARSIPRAVAFGPCFPNDEEVMHQKDEYIGIESLMKAAHIYADAILRMTQSG